MFWAAGVSANNLTVIPGRTKCEPGISRFRVWSFGPFPGMTGGKIDTGSSMTKRQLRLGAFMRPVSIHTGAWRLSRAWPDANFNFAHIQAADTKNSKPASSTRSSWPTIWPCSICRFTCAQAQPYRDLVRARFTLLSALAGATDHIGLNRHGLYHLRPSPITSPPLCPHSITSAAAAPVWNHPSPRQTRMWR